MFYTVSPNIFWNNVDLFLSVMAQSNNTDQNPHLFQHCSLSFSLTPSPTPPPPHPKFQFLSCLCFLTKREALHMEGDGGLEEDPPPLKQSSVLPCQTSLIPAVSPSHSRPGCGHITNTVAPMSWLKIAQAVVWLIGREGFN